jgi:hypothetical protein
MAQQRKDAVKGVVHAAPAPAPKAAGVPELHHISDHQGPSLEGARMRPPRITTQHSTLNTKHATLNTKH